MPKYMIEASYTAQGLRGLQKEKASGRREAVTAAVRALGGKLDSVYYALGEDDVVAIVDMPDTGSVAALCIAVSASGMVRTRTTALMTVEEADKALEKSVSYQPPGGGR